MPIAARIDEFGKPAWIVLMILGFYAWWPLGLAILAFTIGSGRMGCWNQHGMSRQNKGDSMRSGINWWGTTPPSSGNRAFDEYRADTVRRLEEEQREFKDFCSGCALPRTGPSSTSSWPSNAIAPVTTLRNRNPSRNHLLGWVRRSNIG